MVLCDIPFTPTFEEYSEKIRIDKYASIAYTDFLKPLFR